MKHVCLTVAVLAMAGCGGGENNQPAANASSTTEILPEETVPTIEDDGAATAATVSAAFPAPFEGRWGLVPGDCKEGASDAKGLMRVEGATLRFYEAQAKAEKLTIENPLRVSGEFAFSGEGQRWTKMVALTLGNGGNTLTRRETEPPADFRYTKCEG